MGGIREGGTMMKALESSSDTILRLRRKKALRGLKAYQACIQHAALCKSLAVEYWTPISTMTAVFSYCYSAVLDFGDIAKTDQAKQSFETMRRKFDRLESVRLLRFRPSRI